MSDKDLKSYINGYYLDRKMTYTKLDKHDRAIGVLLEENKQLKEDINRILENSYTEEQLDFAVNEVKEQLKAEKQLTDMLHNNIDKLRVKNYKLCEENKQLKENNKSYQEEMARTWKKNDDLKSILTELEEYCKSWKENEKYCYLASNDKDKCRYDIYGEVLNKIQELKEKYK